MKTVLLVAPIDGSGGIQSWTRKYIKTFQSSQYRIIHEPVSRRRSAVHIASRIRRIVDGLLDLWDVYGRVKRQLCNNRIEIMHTTTSGNLGTLRDYLLVRLCKRCGVKTIMHCHYGCITEDYESSSLLGWLLRRTMCLYDQIWVLDSRSEKTLKSDHRLAQKVYLTPNSMTVPASCDFTPKTYTKVGFVGNLIPSKGLYELVQAVVKCPQATSLTIVGPGTQNVNEQIKKLAEAKLGTQIRMIGPLPNNQAVEVIKQMDIIALPTYFPSEAFPISILEAMSYGKMVISTPRAAIKDMLTATDGSVCGMLVTERSINEIVDAICWCQEHPDAADAMCAKAYEKVYSCYRTDVIYSLYYQLYDKILESH